MITKTGRRSAEKIGVDAQASGRWASRSELSVALPDRALAHTHSLTHCLPLTDWLARSPASGTRATKLVVLVDPPHTVTWQKVYWYSQLYIIYRLRSFRNYLSPHCCWEFIVKLIHKLLFLIVVFSNQYL